MPVFLVLFMEKAYRTIKQEAFDEFVEKKSRFIGYAKPVTTQEEAVAFISQIKQKHWDATHNVSAYVLKEQHIQRSSDDGEPSGTAGVPVLDVLLKENLVDVCVVVTRYFGGILLGAGGLIRAYSHGSKIAVDAAKIITMAPCSVLSLTVDYSFYDRLNILLNEFSANIENSQFGENVTITFSLDEKAVNAFQEQLTQRSNGKYITKKIGEKFAEV